MIILGTLFEDEIYEYNPSNKSKHMESRAFRESLVSEFAKPLFYFDVYREKDKSRQVHCLLTDASVIVFNKNSKKVVTILILEGNSIEKYIAPIYNQIDYLSKLNLISCSKINRKRLSKVSSLSDSELKSYLSAKKSTLFNNNNI